LKSLRGRLIALFLLVALSSVAVVGFFAVHQSSGIIVETVWKEGRVLAASLSKEIDAHLRERLALLEFLSMHRQVRGMDREEQRDILSPLFERYGFLEVGVADLEGNIVSNRQEGHVVNVKDRDYFIRTLKEKKPMISDPIASRVTGAMSFAFVVPVFEGGEVVGVLVALESLQALSQRVGETAWGKSGYAYLLNAKGIAVAHPVAEVLGVIDGSVESDKIAPELARAMRDGLSGNFGTVEYRFNGVDQMNAYSPVPSSGWLAAVTVPASEPLAPMRTLRNIVLLVSLLLSVLVVLLSLLAAHGIARPIRGVADILRKNAGLDLRFDASKGWLLDCKITEIAGMVGSLAEMETALTHAILGIAAASEKVGAGAEEFSSLAEETNAGVEESRAGIEDVSSRMEALAASARDIGVGVGEMAAGAQSFARKNAEMASEVESARSAGEDGMRAVERAVSSIVKVAEDAGRSALEIGGLGDRAREIQSFVAQIGGIADQTNLLALNAAIEAARAGEAGRGFAVVAEEVRKLAEESNKAAGRIADLAGGITKDLEKVVTSSRNNAKDSEGASELAQETRRTIEKMMGGLSRISAATQELAAVSQQQASSNEAIAGAVQDVVSRVASSAESADNVRGQMREVGEAGERVAQGAEDLAVLSSELRALVSAFKYDRNRLEVLSRVK